MSDPSSLRPIMTIGGKQVLGDGEFVVINPATGEAAGYAPAASDAHLDAAFTASVDAFDAWGCDWSARRVALEACATALADSVTELAPILTAEQGKPLRDAEGELRGSAAWLRYYAGLALEPEIIRDDEHGVVEVARKPIGPVAAIAPWNFPVMLAMWKLAPALSAGNTVVLKPSPYTPLATLQVGELLSDILPAGVLNVISGGDELGAKMTTHPLARKVSFTGSVETGRKVAVAAAHDLKRVTVELGGNDPAVLLDDAEPADLAASLFRSAFVNNGQVCAAVKRVYVPERLHDALVEALATEAAARRVGNGMDPSSDLGPVQNRAQWTRVSALVSDATRRGATIATGGCPMGEPGSFYTPTILADARDGMPIVDEEQFGPALPVIPYTNVEEAIAHANGTHFGLGASVWTADPQSGYETAARLEAGTTWVNAHGTVGPHVPFGGAKWSGIGVENGRWGLDGFTELRVSYRGAAGSPG